MARRVCWFSCGVASAVATKLAQSESEVTIAYCETGSEHEDNARFLTACEAWFDQDVIRLRNDKFADTWAVWEKRRYLAGISGAPCTRELKVLPRLRFERPDDIHVFGYTADALDVQRADRMRKAYPDMAIETPLIERGVLKEACLEMVARAGIRPPITYAMGFPNANCLPCVKATSPAYWALVREQFSDKFERMANLSRELDVRLARVEGERVFIDEIPVDHPTTNPIMPSCDFLCSLAEQDLNEERAVAEGT